METINHAVLSQKAGVAIQTLEVVNFTSVVLDPADTNSVLILYRDLSTNQLRFSLNKDQKTVKVDGVSISVKAEHYNFAISAVEYGPWIKAYYVDDECHIRELTGSCTGSNRKNIDKWEWSTFAGFNNKKYTTLPDTRISAFCNRSDDTINIVYVNTEGKFTRAYSRPTTANVTDGNWVQEEIKEA
ncbi:uncharacterized protein BDW70DRAFT_164672 [Aspergillus foveolatus]|uniref:uncharacterized protein n=1 Tax=Aspergillus foveolatus TaxID=210207 RepID=UPI003CCE127C